MLSRARDENALRFADAVLHGEPVPPSQALSEFNIEPLETSFTSTVRELAGDDGLVNRTYDLDLFNDDDDDLDYGYSERLPSRAMSARTASQNQNATQFSRTSPSLERRPSSASSTRSARQMTPMGKAIVQVTLLDNTHCWQEILTFCLYRSNKKVRRRRVVIWHENDRSLRQQISAINELP